MPASVLPKNASSIPSTGFVQYGTHPACSGMTSASNTFSTMMAPSNFSSDLQALALAVPAGFNNASLMASQCTNLTRQEMFALSVEVDSSTVMSSTQNKQAVLMPSNIVDEAVVAMSNQSLMLPSGVSNSAVIVHPNIENPPLPLSSHPHILSSLVEANYTYTQKIVIPNSHITNFIMPHTAVSSSYTSDIKPQSFVPNRGTSSSNRSSQTEFINSLQPKFEVKQQPVFTINVIPDKAKHISSSRIPPSDMVFQIKDTLSSQANAFISECSQVSNEIVSPSLCGNAVNDVTFPIESFVKVCTNSDSTMSVAANVNFDNQSVKCSIDPSQQHFTRDIDSFRKDVHDSDFSRRVSPCTGSFCVIVPNIDSFQPPSAYSPQQVACSIDPPQQVTNGTGSTQQMITCSIDSSQHVTCQIAASQQGPCSMESSRQLTCYTESYQQSVNSSHPGIESSQLAIDSSEQVTHNAYSSRHVTPVTDSSSQVALINTVQQVTSTVMDCQNIACISQVPSCAASTQQIVSQVTQRVETSAISSQGLVSTMAYSEHVAFSTSSLQMPVLGKDSLQEFATTVFSPGQIAPEINDFPESLTCDVKIKPEPVDVCDEMSAAYSVALISSGAYNSEVKLNLKDKKPEAVFCDAYTLPDSTSSWSVTSEVETDPLGTYSDAKISLPAATAPIPCKQNAEPDTLGIIDVGSEMLTGVCSPQITLILPPIQLGGEFQNIDSSHSLPDCSFPVKSSTVISNSEIPADNVAPNLACTGTSDSSHVQHLTPEKTGKLPIPRLVSPRPDPPKNLLAPAPKVPKPKPVSYPKPVFKKILPKPSKCLECLQVGGSSTPRTDILLEPTLFNNLNVPTSFSLVEIQGEKMLVASNSSPDGNCHQGALEAGQLNIVAAGLQNDSSQNSSHDDGTVPDVAGAATKIQQAKLSSNRLPADGSGVLTNDRRDMMSVICKNCNPEELVTSHYPVHENAYKCDMCQKPCYQYIFRYNCFHAVMNDGTVLEQCHKCSNGSPPNTTVKVKYNQPQYVCDICGITYKSFTGFKVHYSTHTNVFRYRCDQCGKGFHYRNVYLQHQETHSVDLKYHCPICFKKLKSKHSLQLHKQRNHSAKVPLPCETCGTVFYHSNSYWRHQRKVHKVITGVQCSTCLKYFLNLNQHVCIPFYECDVCGNRFKTRQLFKIHFRSHSD